MINLESRLKAIIIKNSLKVISEGDINETSNLTNDFEYDSVKIIELIVDLEAEFNISIEDEDMDINILTNYELLKNLLLMKLQL